MSNQSNLRPGMSLVILAACASMLGAQQPDVLPNTKPLTGKGDLSAEMVSGIDRYLTRETERVQREERPVRLNRLVPSAEEFQKNNDHIRSRLRRLIGAVDPRPKKIQIEWVSSPRSSVVVAETDLYTINAIRWTAFGKVYGEGLLLTPKRPPVARIVALPDADQTPEMLAGLNAGDKTSSPFARHFAEAGCQVIVPVLIDRHCTWSGNPDLFMTNQTHREWVYRQAFEMGRHIIGYEVQKVLAAVDWFASQKTRDSKCPIGVAGYGEGGMIALYSAAVDRRIDATLVSGYFDSRHQLWQEPVYRNVFGLLREFDDAEIAGLIAPRSLIVEHSLAPTGENARDVPEKRRQSAAPGKLSQPSLETVRRELKRAEVIAGKFGAFKLIADKDNKPLKAGSSAALTAFLKKLDVAYEPLPANRPTLADRRQNFDPAARQKRQFEELVDHSQRLLRRSERIRADFWKDANRQSIDSWLASTRSYKDYLAKNIIGVLEPQKMSPNVRTRKIEEQESWTAYEVVLDVCPNVFAWGYLLVPKGIKPKERRPVVVCQHGLEGLPESVVTKDKQSRGYRAYRAYAARLAERGFITYAPHNPYRGGVTFRQLQRKANPLGLTLFSFIIAQHEATLDWLTQLPFVDAKRIGFYGLSYGGTSAVRIPALVDRYALSICSACFNDWTRKIMSLDFRSSYMFTAEYEQFCFDQGSTFNHAEYVSLISPRPFMVERGHRDGVAPDEWVAYEYAKVRRHYADLKIPERTEIEFFDGGHVINGQRTFDFLHRHLKWPQPREAKHE